ncbi:hypothetical protein B9Z19DRAFT_251182 [Tuber borchii]|uniref:Uncharacterized protein n=1 Tax=Tuber borchii TaxID=42251 RepID=A0A2T6ZLZ0_TUBBO|nr:hypothetical protein B9Z19DRAFT_251182 [Tuber borchii]
MARPSYPKSTVWEKGCKKNYHQFISSFPPSSHSNPKTQHRSQLALPSHKSSPLDTLLSQPIEFIKTQTTSKPFTGDQTMSSFGYFNNKKMKRKGNSVSSKDKVNKMKRDTTIKNVDRPDLSEDQPLDQSQSSRGRRVAGEGSIEKTTHKIPAKKTRQPSTEKFGILPKERQIKPDEELADAAPIKPKTSYRIGTKLNPVLPKEGKERNGLPKVPHLPKPGVLSGSCPVSTTPPPNRTTPLHVSERMAILEVNPTTKNKSKNLKPNPNTIVNTSGKIVVSGKSDLKRKPEALSEQPPKRRHHELRVKGLANTSFFCYRNSVLQFLASSTSFIKENIRHTEEKCHCGPYCTSCALGHFFHSHFRPAGGKHALNQSLKMHPNTCLLCSTKG